MLPVKAPGTSELSPGQAAFRFVVELAALVAWGIVGWQLADGGVRWLAMIALPIAGAVLWGTFRAPGDASAGSDGTVRVAGVARLAIELVVLLGAALALAITWHAAAGAMLAAVVVAHYVATHQRVRWLFGRPRRPPSTG